MSGIGESEVLPGGCLCGAIRYRLHGPTLFVSQCCCKDCQKATGTGHTTIVGIHRSQLELEGTPTTYTNVGATGGSVTRHFCGNCGGRLYTSGDLLGEFIMIQAGSLDNPEAIYPESVIYLKDAVAWDRFDPDLPMFQGMQARSQPTERLPVRALAHRSVRSLLRGFWSPCETDIPLRLLLTQQRMIHYRLRAHVAGR